MLPVEIGRALHVLVPSVWQALDISLIRPPQTWDTGAFAETPKASASARRALAFDSYS
jgi:hypothetical protein